MRFLFDRYNLIRAWTVNFIHLTFHLSEKTSLNWTTIHCSALSTQCHVEQFLVNFTASCFSCINRKWTIQLCYLAKTTTKMNLHDRYWLESERKCVVFLEEHGIIQAQDVKCPEEKYNVVMKLKCAEIGAVRLFVWYFRWKMQKILSVCCLSPFLHSGVFRI